MRPVQFLSAVSLLLAIATHAAANSSDVVTRVVGKSRAQVEKLLGKGTEKSKSEGSGGTFIYHPKGFQSVEVEYGGLNNPPELTGKVVYYGLTFLRPVKDWKGALKAAGLSTNGVAVGTGKSEGYFKNVPGVAKGFIGSVGTDSLSFTHWSYLSFSTWPFTRPKGE